MSEDNRPLWAPWRIEFIRANNKNHSCFLCDNKSPRENSLEEPLIIARGKFVFAILNRYPYNAGHLLIAPYRHEGDIAELNSDELHELMDFAVIAKKVMHKTIKPEAYNVGFNLGKAAGAGVAEHLHMHIVPRWSGDTNFMPVLADIHCVPEALEATAQLLRDNWESV